jgi:hypothetical protein
MFLLGGHLIKKYKRPFRQSMTSPITMKMTATIKRGLTIVCLPLKKEYSRIDQKSQ